MNKKLLIATILILIILIFPLFVTQIIIKSEQYPYVFKARFIEKVDEVKGGLIQSYLVERVSGNLPENQFIISLSIPFTKGYSGEDIKINQELRIQGKLVKAEKDFYKRGYDSIIANQIKSIFWPNTVSEIKKLYLSPLFVGLSLFIPFTPFLGGSINILNWIMGLILTIGSIIMLVINLVKKKGWNILLIILIFYLLSMIHSAFLPIT